MTQLKIKDNAYTSKEPFREIGHVTEIIADKTLTQLEREGFFVFPEQIKDAEDISKEQLILQSVNDCYRSSNVMGFLGYGKERLVIESRFSIGEQDYFFHYLLERVLDFPNMLNLHTDTNQERRWLDLLQFLFPYYLKAAMRKGLFKTYLCNKYNDENVKGSIDIARHIMNNTPFIGKIAYNQREFSYDNSLLELIRHTIEFIKKKPYGNNLLQKAKDEVVAVIGVTTSYEYYDRRKIIAENKKRPLRHAYYREYRALQYLCIMILQYERHQIGPGIRQIHGILFDGAWLWEEYVNLLIGSEFYHPMNKGGMGAQRLFDGNRGLIYPDFISRNTDNRTIADAKYKPFDNIKGNDYHQLLAYMFRFDAKKGYYLYPQSHSPDDIKLKLNCGSTYEKNVAPREDISIFKIGLAIPNDASDYADFIGKIKISEERFKNSVFVTESYL